WPLLAGNSGNFTRQSKIDGSLARQLTMCATFLLGYIKRTLLHIACHIAVEHSPYEKRPVQPLQITQCVTLWHLNLDAKVLLRCNHHWLSEAECSLWVRIAVCRHTPVLRVWPSTSGEEVRWHLNPALLTHVEGGDGVVDELAN